MVAHVNNSYRTGGESATSYIAHKWTLVAREPVALLNHIAGSIAEVIVSLEGDLLGYGVV